MAVTFRQGQHICALFDDEPQMVAMAATYLHEGIVCGEQVMYVARSIEARDRLRAALRSQKLDVDEVLARGGLLEATHEDAHLAGGHFDAERMIRLLNDAVETALNRGFTGLRACGDMSWLLEEPSGFEQVVEYEALLNELFRGVRALGMCLYDRTLMPPNLLDHALATHSTAFLDGTHVVNPFYESSPTAQTRTADPRSGAARMLELRRLAMRESS
jgi:hypothetical protein